MSPKVAELQGDHSTYLSFRNVTITLTLAFLPLFTQKYIDVVKFDIENCEFRLFYQLINSGVLRDVKQVAFEIHMFKLKKPYKGKIDIKANFLGLYRALKTTFELNGFKLWASHENEDMMRRGHPDEFFEIYWINTRFLKP